MLDIQKNNQIENSLTKVLERDMRACFNGSAWSTAMKMQQKPLETQLLKCGDCLVRVLQNFRTSRITTVMACLAAQTQKRVVESAVWQNFQCAVLTARTIPMKARNQSASQEDTIR